MFQVIDSLIDVNHQTSRLIRRNVVLTAMKRNTYRRWVN
nr:MAG TPA: hypothetical protein [Bacteriophage sp.]